MSLRGCMQMLVSLRDINRYHFIVPPMPCLVYPFSRVYGCVLPSPSVAGGPFGLGLAASMPVRLCHAIIF